MDSSSSPVEIFFFPFVGGGHQIPMVDMARVFASHNAKATIITTPKHALFFQKCIDRDKNSGRPISIRTLILPGTVDIADTDMSAAPFTDTSMLREPLRKLLVGYRPLCIVHDTFHGWCTDTIDSVGIPRITFGGNACFSLCVHENLHLYRPHEKVNSDFEPFIVPGLPDRIELTRSQLPFFIRQQHGGFGRNRPKLETGFGRLVNSFYELEPAYVEYVRNELGIKAWVIGPVSLCNTNMEDKTERGKKATIDEQSILSWLDSKEPNSVLYTSFGSLAQLTTEQLLEIANGLEAANHPFIWVVGNISKSNGNESQGNWLPNGFEDRIRQSHKGLIIKGWAPQLLILEHKAVGGFMTHCGWNSVLEGVSCGVPMVTFPITAEQFSNEKLISDVLKIGVKVGSMEWVSFNTKPSAPVGREKVEKAVKILMGVSEEAKGMRRRAKELRMKAIKAVGEDGSSYKDVHALIQELKSCQRN